jgi:hypothetical protein
MEHAFYIMQDGDAQYAFVAGGGRRHTAIRNLKPLDVVSSCAEGVRNLPRWLAERAFPQQVLI